MYGEIRLIEKDTDLSELNMSKMNWDVNVKGIPYQIVRIEGYVHSIGGGKGNNDYWAYPLGEAPSYENLVEFSGHSCRWSFKVEENNYLKSKWGETEILGNCKCTIYRNDEKFYELFGSFDYCIAKAQVLIIELQSGGHPICFNHRGYEKEIVDRKIYWNDQPAIIERYLKGSCRVIIKSVDPNGFKPLSWMDDEDDYEDKFEIVDDLLQAKIDWFRD